MPIGLYLYVSWGWMGHPSRDPILGLFRAYLGELYYRTALTRARAR